MMQTKYTKQNSYSSLWLSLAFTSWSLRNRATAIAEQTWLTREDLGWQKQLLWMICLRLHMAGIQQGVQSESVSVVLGLVLFWFLVSVLVQFGLVSKLIKLLSREKKQKLCNQIREDNIHGWFCPPPKLLNFTYPIRERIGNITPLTFFASSE